MIQTFPGQDGIYQRTKYIREALQSAMRHAWTLKLNEAAPNNHCLEKLASQTMVPELMVM